jgi:hypothetical protein
MNRTDAADAQMATVNNTDDAMAVRAVLDEPMPAEWVVMVEEGEEAGTENAGGMELSSVLKKRRRKMNRHKYKKWRKKMRTILRKLK